MAGLAAAPKTANRFDREKLAPLPSNARISKRPLLRPAIPSPYTNSKEQKIVYLSAKTPFLSAVKRVEKLLALADKRLVQSATTIAQQDRQNKFGGKKRKRGKGTGADEEEILDIAETVEALKRKKKAKVDNDKHESCAGESVTVKGTGKAIQKVLELGLWFQQREDQYTVKLNTGSVAAIDDITIDSEDEHARENPGSSTNIEDGGVGSINTEVAEMPTKGKKRRKRKPQSAEPLSETRIRYTSVLELVVALR